MSSLSKLLVVAVLYSFSGLQQMWQADDMVNVSLSQYKNNPYSYASLLILSSYPSMKTLIVLTTTSVPNPLLTCEIISQFHVL